VHVISELALSEVFAGVGAVSSQVLGIWSLYNRLDPDWSWHGYLRMGIPT